MKYKSFRIINLITLMVLTLTIIMTSVFAWTIFNDNVNNLDLKLTKIDSEIYLYQGIDSNNNGVPDMLSEYSQNEIAEIQTGYPLDKTEYYKENRAFTYIGKQYALSTEPEASQVLQYDLGTFYPTQAKTIKLSIINHSDGANYVSFTFREYDYSQNTEMLNVLKTMSFRVLRINQGEGINSESQAPDVSDKYYFCDYISNSKILTHTFFENEDNYKVEGQLSKDENKNDDVLDFWVVYKMEDYDTLIQKGVSITKNEYNALSNVDVDLPDLLVNLELRIDNN
ncbi:MAG: hypothetical protein K6G28_04325 [Acholeplasmatales bacterium]|nr:hypothetical protein [Acholeplasmatales bacterium]